MKKFELILKNEKIKIYNRISWLVIALNFFAFIYIAYLLRGYTDAKWPLIGACLILFSLLFFWIRKKTKRRQLLSFSTPLIFALITWIQLKNYWLAAAILLLIIFEELARKELAVKFFDDKIIFPSFPEKIIQWKELNNVILKDGVLTIDFKNNKLIQTAVMHPDIDYDLEEMFNAFCKDQLNIKRISLPDAEY